MEQREKTESVSKGEEQSKGKGVLVQKLIEIIELELSSLFLMPFPVGLLGNPLINRLGA